MLLQRLSQWTARQVVHRSTLGGATSIVNNLRCHQVLGSGSRTQQQVRCVWSAGQDPFVVNHPSSSLTPNEIKIAATAVKKKLSGGSDGDGNVRFVSICLSEPDRQQHKQPPSSTTLRNADVIVLNSDGIATEVKVALPSGDILESTQLPPGVQPMFTPEDCDLAEEIAHNSPELQQALKDRYGITDPAKQVAADPWSVHLANPADEALTMDKDGRPRRLVQTFLYYRLNSDVRDNHYAHPIDLVPIVDLNSRTIVKIDGLDRAPAPSIPKIPVNYHRDLVKTNTYVQNMWRTDVQKALNITQPDGPSFTVTDGNLVEWQGWSLRVGFHYREGLVLHDVHFNGRPVMKRGSLVEMSVPYADPNPPYPRKCALDVGDYGLGYCANSLELGCDCLGHIHYFDGCLTTAKGEPRIVPKVICLHEEDDGILWKHVEYRNGHNEARRTRELVLSSIATVVNYEYLFYWRLKLDGSIDFEIRLSGELSTNLPSAGENEADPAHGKLVAPRVNAQIHQHMFCARLDMSVDGDKNTVSEVDVVTKPYCPEKNPYGNIFEAQERVLPSEQEAVRLCDANKARTWKIANAEGKVNPVTKKPTAYKLVPFTRGAAQPPLLTHPEECNVSHKSKFATAHLWVTKYDAKERYPAGEYPTQATMEQIKKAGGLPQWIQDDAYLKDGEDVVLWHSFGVTHVPRVEDFPVMPCETTGFTLKPDGFSAGNPAIDIPPDMNEKSKLAPGCCSK